MCVQHTTNPVTTTQESLGKEENATPWGKGTTPMTKALRATCPSSTAAVAISAK